MLYELVLAGLEQKVRRYLDEHPAAANDLLHGDIPPLHAALSTQAGTQLTPLLIERGADLERCDGAGRTALHAAIDQARVRAAATLRAIGDLDIFAAAGLGEESRVAELLASDPKLARESQADGTTALFFAVLAGNVSIASELLDARSDPSPRSTRHWACIAPLHLAIMRKHTPLVALLLSRGSDPDAHSSAKSYGPTPLHIAARWGEHEDIVRLLEAGANLFAGGPVSRGIGPSVLGWVAYGGQVDTLRLLIDYGLDVRDTRCGAVIHLAAAKGHTALVDVLLRHDVDLGGLDGEGRTPLEHAIEQGQIETVEFLQQRRKIARAMRGAL
jgi:ankyrin repeat protein